MNFAVVNRGAIDLFTGLTSNTWPTYFLEKLLGLSKESIVALPTIALWVLGIYMVFAVAALSLKKWKQQKSYSDMIRKLVDCICIIVGTMCLWIVPQFIAQGKVLASGVEGSFSFSAEGVKWLSEFMQAWFDPIFLLIVLLAFALLPVFTMVRYFKGYKLWGLIWIVYDTCFGVVIVAAAVLAMYHGDFKWYLVILPPLVLNLLGQRGGVIRDNNPEQGK